MVSNPEMRVCSLVLLILLLAPFQTSEQPKVAPQVVYATYLGGRHKDFASAIAVDRLGAAYVAGRTLSPDFPVTQGALITTSRINNDDWIGFVTKLTEKGDRFSYSTLLGGNYRSSANAISVDSSGRALVVGSTCSSNFPTTPKAIFRRAPGSTRPDACDAFLAVLNSTGAQLDYGTYLGGRDEDSASAIALDERNNTIYVGGYTSSSDFPVTESAAQRNLRGVTNGFLSAIDIRAGKLLYSTFLGGNASDAVTAIAVSPDGAVYVAGITQSTDWPGVAWSRYGETGGSDGFVLRIDPTTKSRVSGIRIGGSGDETLTAIALDSQGDIYAVGSTDSRDFPLTSSNRPAIGSGYILKIDGRKFASERPSVVWSTRVGGHIDDALLAVSAGMSGSVFLAGRSSSPDFPTTPGAFHHHLSAQNDSVLVRLRSSDGQLRFATFLGGTTVATADWHNDAATGILADSSGNVYVSGYSIDDRLPVTPGAPQPKRKGNTEPFVLRLRF
jgi:Beta-propeller repeat